MIVNANSVESHRPGQLLCNSRIRPGGLARSIHSWPLLLETTEDVASACPIAMPSMNDKRDCSSIKPFKTLFMSLDRVPVLTLEVKPSSSCTCHGNRYLRIEK